MSWILHLSDPHLGDVSPGQDQDDQKVLLPGQPDRETTQTVFLRTLATLGSFVKDHGKPSVVVVSGDMTYRARRGGFDAFIKLLRDRSDIFPGRRRDIVVVPGNHDVVWDKSPGVRPRYADFLRATRSQRCATPLLDGVDFDVETGELLAPALKHTHLVSHEDLLVVPFNSSNYCGELVDLPKAYTEAQWRDALKPLARADRTKALAELKRLRQQDIPRVTRKQIEALNHLFAELGEPRSRADDDRVRIAVLHHQLLPLSTREERKPYESLMNLGLVRETFRDFGFDVVLHGHKHESGLYWDVAGAASDPIGGTLRRMLVIASPGQFGVGTPAMRALMLEGPRSARNLRIVTFNGSGAARTNAAIENEEVAPLWLGAMDEESATRSAVQGRNAHLAYARVRSLFELRGHEQLANLVCQVDNPADAITLPPDYPSVGIDEPQAWFAELVRWWQRKDSELVRRDLTPFNHGERIYRQWGDQVDRAVRLLKRREGSSRALVQLIDPRETGRHRRDTRDLKKGTFPAFVLAEFSVVRREPRRYLDCVAYFRKQEMQYWWPVNLAELRQLQEIVAGRVKIRPGRIVTVSAIALWNSDLPAVAVPELDRLIETPERLWAMAAALAFPKSDARDAAIEDWTRVLAELSGAGRESLPRPRGGVVDLGAEVQRVASLTSDRSVAAVADALADLEEKYASYAETEKLNPAATNVIVKAVKKLRAAVASVLPLDER